MIICVTLANNKQSLFVRGDHVRSITRRGDNPLITFLETTAMTPQGFLGWDIIDSPESVARQLGWLGSDSHDKNPGSALIAPLPKKN